MICIGAVYHRMGRGKNGSVEEWKAGKMDTRFHASSLPTFQ
jgi:hypothetical protein